MKAWAIVIGRKKSKQYERYIAYARDGLLAVYETRSVARRERHRILKTCGHKHVYVIPLETKGD